MKWNDYINGILKKEWAFDNIRLSLNGESGSYSIPPIIKASILLLDRMISAQGQYNILVFPEKFQTLFIFMLIKVLHNIMEGKIKKSYNPDSFEVGEKLKFGNCVVEFNGEEIRDSKLCLKFKTSDCSISAPVKILPLFQRTNTKRRLSSYHHFIDAKHRANKILGQLEMEEESLVVLADYKTHLDSSIFYIAPIISTKEQLKNCKLNGKSIEEILLIGHADYTGEIRNIGAGQLAGIPAIVLSSDLYAVCEAVIKNTNIESLIVDVSNSGTINSQLDAIDDLMHMGVLITCITDVADSFDLQHLVDRSFNIWRWDEDYITDGLYGTSPLLADQKTKHCAKRIVEYITVTDNEISDSLKKLYQHRTELRDQSAQIINLFDRLFTAILAALRAATPIFSAERALIQHNLSECDSALEKERAFMSDDSYSDYKTIIHNLKEIFSSAFTFPKHFVLQEHLKANKYPAVYIIVQDKSDKNSLQRYWKMWCSTNELETKITILYPAEYYSMSHFDASVTIVTGWLNNITMRKILYGFNTDKYIVLMYDYEWRWKNSHITMWSRALDNTNNKNIVKKSLNTDSMDISVNSFHDKVTVVPEQIPDELDEIELVLRENKHRQYFSGDGQHSTNETVEAIPVNFVGGYLAFFRITHKVVTATNIIINAYEKISMKIPSQLKIGDFVVVREADRDLIRELADTILENSNKHGLRDIATKWRESLTMKCKSSSNEKIYKKLQAVGCQVSYQTVHGWITDEEKIAPERRENLIHIAQITGDSVLLEMIDQVFSAAREVKNAHIQAGKYLSGQLKKTIASALREYEDINPYNIWEPIALTLEDIGTVKILKVIDIGTTVMVDVTNTNRLLEER